MERYSYTKILENAWQQAVALYEQGQREAGAFFDEEQTQQLAAIGVTAQEVFDFAEDYHNAGEPSFATFAQIQGLRYYYLTHVQQGSPSQQTVPIDVLPPKDAAYRGITWLPRILTKARAKLRGEIAPEYMYGCGGDRRFCRTHNIDLAELLLFIWQHPDNDDAVADFVLSRNPAAAEA